MSNATSDATSWTAVIRIGAPKPERLTDRRKFRINDLPKELRLLILSHMIIPSIIPIDQPSSSPRSEDGLGFPSIIYAGDKTLRLEALLLAIPQTAFEIFSSDGRTRFEAWLAFLDFSSISSNYKDGFDLVRTLLFPCFSVFPYKKLAEGEGNGDVVLMRKCRNLQEAKVRFYFKKIVTRQQPGGRAVQALRREYRLDGMLELRELRRLVLLGRDVPALQRLGEWFREGFEARGKKVEVTRLCV